KPSKNSFLPSKPKSNVSTPTKSPKSSPLPSAGALPTTSPGSLKTLIRKNECPANLQGILKLLVIPRRILPRDLLSLWVSASPRLCARFSSTHTTMLDPNPPQYPPRPQSPQTTAQALP